jgi:hypothetical protein
MKDINGGELRQGGMAMLLCEVLAIEPDGVRVRVMNSELEILVGAKHDEVLGGIVADSELTAFDPDADLPTKALKECFVDLGALLHATTWELAPEVREQLQRTQDLALHALGFDSLPCPTPSK